MEKRNTTRRFIEEFKTQREQWKDRELAKMEEENEKIREYVKMQQMRENERQEAKKALDEHRAGVQNAVSGEENNHEPNFCVGFAYYKKFNLYLPSIL